MQIALDPHEVQRQVELAFSLEAIIPKEGCTSRYEDVGPKQRFEYFLFSALNAGRYFCELAERITKAQGQPRVFYDLAYAAMMDSQRTRGGKIVNYGLLEAMFPVVVARYALPGGRERATELVADVLKATSKEDVHCLSEMRRVVYTRSDKEFKRSFPFHEEGGNVFEHYQYHRGIAHEVSRLFVEELMCGMPLATLIYETIRGSDGALAERVERGFATARRRSKLPCGALADHTAVALFLMIADDPKRQVIE